MKLLLYGLVVLFILFGCRSAQIEQQEKNRSTMADVLDRFKELDAREAAEWQSTKYDALRPHLAYEDDAITDEMLQSDKEPEQTEKDALFEWAEFGAHLNEQRLQVAKEYLAPEFVERFDHVLFNMIGKRLELYEGKITYGEYLVQMKALGDEFRTDMADLADYHADLVDKAEQRRAEQKESWIRQQERMHEQRQRGGRSYGPLKCEEIGDFVHCRF